MPRHQRVLVADGSKYFDTSIWHRLIPDTEFEIVGLAGSTDETIEMAITQTPDIVLIDLSHSQICGLQTVTALHAVHPNLPIITFMPISSHEYTRASLDAGATACLPKDEMADVLLQTLRYLTSTPLSAMPVS